MASHNLALPIEQGVCALITCDNWFQAPNGQDYKIVWGRCYYLEAKEVLGFIPKGGSNWFVQVGQGDGALLIAGCQIHYAIRCDVAPNQLLSGGRFYVPKSEEGKY